MKRMVLALIVGLILNVSLSWGVEELERKGYVIRLTGDRDARGVADVPGVPDDFQLRRSCRMPDMLALSDTEWLVVYTEMSGGTTTGNWTRLVVDRTEDGGKSWTRQIVSEQKKSDPKWIGHWNMTRMGLMPDGTIIISSCVRYKGNRCYLFFSDDNGKSWKGPIDSGIQEAAKAVLGHDVTYIESDRPVALDDGTIYMSACRGQVVANPPASFGDKKKSVEVIDVFISKDKGHTWEYVSTVMDMEHDLSEAAILADGKDIQIYCRDDRKEPLDSREPTPRGLVVFRSGDRGRTWAKVKFATEAPGHQPGVCKLKNGKAIVIYRRADSDRVSSEVWVHDPKTLEGKTYTVHYIKRTSSVFKIDSGAVCELSDGRVLLCYSSYRQDENPMLRYAEKRVRIAVMPPVDQWDSTKPYAYLRTLDPDVYTSDLETLGRVIQVTDNRDAYGVPDGPVWEKTPEVSWDQDQRRSTRMPDMLVLNDREWLVTYCEYPGPTSTGVYSRLVVKKTSDAGKTWTTPLVNEQRKGEDGFLGNWNMSRFGKLPDGRIVITSCVRWGGGRCWLFSSDDDGEHWSGPMDCGLNEIMEKQVGVSFGHVESSQVVALNDGSVILGAHRGRKDVGKAKRYVTDIFRSIDGCKSWEYRSTIKDDRDAPCEPALLVDKHTILAYCRDEKPWVADPYSKERWVGYSLAVFRSKDAGLTWRKVDIGADILGQQPGICRLKDGRALVIYRHADNGHVGCYIWVHDPKTFAGQTFAVHNILKTSSIFKIDSGAAAELQDGTVLLCYSSYRRDDGVNFRYPEKRVRIAVLPGVELWCKK